MPLTLRNTKGSALTFTELDDNFSFVQLPVGVLLPYAGSSAPTNFLLCYGQAVSRTTYAALFSAIGTTYGTGDGSTTFNLPDLRGRSVFGVDNMGGSAASRVTSGVSGIAGTTLGATGGSQYMQTHSHTVNDSGHTHGQTNGIGGSGGSADGPGAVGYGSGTNTEAGITGITIANAGSGSSQNMPPAMMLSYIIRAL